MNTGRTVFSQIMDLLPHRDFRKCAKRYQGDRKIQKFSCMDQFFCMAFAQLTYRESLQNIEESGLKSQNVTVSIKTTGVIGLISKVSSGHFSANYFFRADSSFIFGRLRHRLAASSKLDLPTSRAAFRFLVSLVLARPKIKPNFFTSPY